MLEDSLVEAFVATAEQGQRRFGSQLLDQLVIEDASTGGQGQHAPMRADLRGIRAVAGSERRLHHIHAQHHAGAAAERRVIHLAAGQRRVIAVIDVPETMPGREGVADMALGFEPLKPLWKQREDVNLHS